MDLNDSVNGPGADNALSSMPKEDRLRAGFARDTPCRTKTITKQQVDRLIKTAVRLGAGDAKCICSSDIVAEGGLASLCNSDPTCENYGRSASCPPHVAGPAEFRNWQGRSVVSIVVKIDLPSETLFSSERQGIFRLLHEIVAKVEQEAVGMGFTGTKAFAGGSCKQLFCWDKDACLVTSKQGKCRNPETARPSMSGFGINVGKLMQSAGWPLKMGIPEKQPQKESVTWVAGLILIAGSSI